LKQKESISPTKNLFLEDKKAKKNKGASLNQKEIKDVNGIIIWVRMTCM